MEGKNQNIQNVSQELVDIFNVLDNHWWVEWANFHAYYFLSNTVVYSATRFITHHILVDDGYDFGDDDGIMVMIKMMMVVIVMMMMMMIPTAETTAGTKYDNPSMHWI